MKKDGPHEAGRGLLLLAKHLRELLPKNTISAAVFGTSWYGNNYDSAMWQYLDWVGIMSYDLTGSWNDSPVGPHASLYKIRNQSQYENAQHSNWPGQGKDDNPILSVEETVWYWSNPFYVNWQGQGANVPRNKLVLGVPTYGYDFAYSRDSDDLSGDIPPSFKVVRYKKDIVKQFPDAENAENANIKKPGNTNHPSFTA